MKVVSRSIHLFQFDFNLPFFHFNFLVLFFYNHKIYYRSLFMVIYDRNFKFMTFKTVFIL